MKCTIPEISWHNRDPVLSVDIQPICNEEFYRLASGGADCHVLIWYLKIRENGAVDVDIVSDLNRHQRAVNAVRWSPSGQYLATGDDDANIIIWNLKTDNIPLLEGETADKETWIVNKILRGHKEDVYDICWSPNGMKLLSGSIDNTAILWDLSRGQNEYILTDHKGFVQGVTWDPKGQFIATLSSDRTCRIFDNTGRNIKARTYKGTLPVPEEHLLFNKEVKYFHDDTFKSYFRRLSFSPDGTLLIAPSGCIEVDDYKDARHATFVFTLDCLTQPVAVLPSPKQITIAVRCCPVLFELRSGGTDPVIVLPYRIVIAVATDSDVVLYDTQQLTPFAHLRKIHYTRITDLTWSLDGLLLIACSTDGFCTLITFEPEELGVEYVKEDSEPEESLLDISGCEETDKAELNKQKKEIEQIDVKVKKPTILDQWAVRTPKRDTSEENIIQNLRNSQKELKGTKQPVNEAPSTSCSEKVEKPDSKKLVRKRIAPIKVADIQKSDTDANKTKSKTVSEDSEIQECKEKEDDVMVVDDYSVNDAISEASPSSKNGHSCNKNKFRKRNAEPKKSQTPIKSNALLKFIQVGAAKKKSTESNVFQNKNTSTPKAVCAQVLAIVDNNAEKVVCETKSEKGIVSQNIKVEDRRPHTETWNDIIEIFDSDSNSSQSSICNKVDQASITDIANKNGLKSEKSKMEECSTSSEVTNPTEKENLETKERSGDDIAHSTTAKLLVGAKTPTGKTLRRIPFVTLSSPKRKKNE